MQRCAGLSVVTGRLHLDTTVYTARPNTKGESWSQIPQLRVNAIMAPCGDGCCERCGADPRGGSGTPN